MTIHFLFSRWSAPLVLTLLLGMASLPAATAHDSDDDLGWKLLGPEPGRSGGAFAVSPSWPEQRVILLGYDANGPGADSGAEIFGTEDGGRSWARSTIDNIRLGKLILPEGAPGSVPVLATSRAADEDGRVNLFRSLDGGISWERHTIVDGLPPLSESNLDLTVPPGFATTGHLFALVHGRPFISADKGVTWAPLELPVDLIREQSVRELIASPGFADDGTLYARVTDGGSARFQLYRSAGLPGTPLPTSHIESVGIIRSIDRGTTWQAVTSGLEIDGAPYHNVQLITLAPTFAQRRELFVYARGPAEDVEIKDDSELLGRDLFRARGVHSAIFLSPDGGETWEVIYRPSWRPLSSLGLMTE